MWVGAECESGACSEVDWGIGILFGVVVVLEAVYGFWWCERGVRGVCR